MIKFEMEFYEISSVDQPTKNFLFLPDKKMWAKKYRADNLRRKENRE